MALHEVVSTRHRMFDQNNETVFTIENPHLTKYRSGKPCAHNKQF